jgi:hypothetical protein
VLAYPRRGLYYLENGGDSKLKNYECVEVKHHKDVGKTIEEYERNGWRLTLIKRLAWVQAQWHTALIITCCLRGASEH